MKNILVYCGSSAGYDAVYSEVATAAGKSIAAKGQRLIYGAGSGGIMGIIADSVLAAGGEVIGVIPSFMGPWEVQHPNLTECHVVESMHARKQLMAEISDAVVALPGGWGTMDELFEILTWRQLGLHKMPVGLLNVNGFYDPLIAMIDKMVTEGFLKDFNRELLLIDTDFDSLMNQLENHEVKDTSVDKWIKSDKM